MIRASRYRLLQTGAAMLAKPAAAGAETETDIGFYFPVGVGRPIATIVDGYAAVATTPLMINDKGGFR